MNDEEVKIEEEISDLVLEVDNSEITELLNDISSNQDKIIEHLYPEYTEEEIQVLQDEIENERIYKEKMEKALDIIIESEDDSEILNEVIEIKEYITQNDLEQEAHIEQEALISSIQEDLILTNSYLYTINVYLAGFFVIVICYILTKLLIGFFKPFL